MSGDRRTSRLAVALFFFGIVATAVVVGLLVAGDALLALAAVVVALASRLLVRVLIVRRGRMP